MGVSVTGSTCERTGNLPVEVTSFVGRRQEIAEVKRLLSKSRLVTLTGSGGVGKTRLALRVADEVRRTFSDGVWLVSLAELEDPGLLTETVASVLGVQDYSAHGLMATLTEVLRPRHLLLVMDNCEHLVDAAAVFIDILLRVAPKLRVLATSRQSLGTSVEQAWSVPPLSLPDLPNGSRVQVPAHMLARSEAVSLFAERARTVLSNFELTPDNGRAVVEICRRLDGIPLALELATVRLRAMSADEIVRRLDDRFRLLTVGNRAGVSRQQTLWALIDWSYAHCTDAERTLWGRASAFSGGFDLAAAEQVCAGDRIAAEDVLDLVDGLVDKSILCIDRNGDVIRYRMLESIRQYAHHRLRISGRLTVVRRRHRDYFQTLVAEAKRQWFGPDQTRWFTRVRREHANLQAALEFCLTEPGQAQAGLTIATDMAIFFFSGYLSEGRRWYERALGMVGESTSARAEGLWDNAWIAFFQNNASAAVSMLQECQTLAEALGDRVNFARASALLGWISLNEGDPASAITLLERALAEHSAIGDLFGVATAQNLLAHALFESGHIDRAAALFEECLAFCQAHGETWTRSWALFQFAYMMWRQGDHQRAWALLTECLRHKIEFDDRLAIGHCMERLAWITVASDPERAARLFGAAQMVLRSIGASLFFYMRTDHDRCIADVRATLGNKTFTAKFEQGAALTLENAIAEVIHKKGRNEASTASDKERHWLTPLTSREREIAALVAKGLTNKEIAEQLVISRRTVESHIEHIMVKLGFTTRTQITALVSGKHDAT